MDLSPDIEAYAEAVRRDGWTPALKARFLVLLAESGNVRLSARRCGLSAQSAYVQRRRDPVFARGWAGAVVQARDHAEQVLADRAIEGVEEQVFYRGELIGTRRRYDSRLLLAHLARLDRQADAAGADEEAERFDELVALVAGAQVPEALLTGDDDLLPPARGDHAEAAARAAEDRARRDLPHARNASDEAERDAAIVAAGDAAHAAADAEWEMWYVLACDTADASRAAVRPCPQDGVNPSTSARLSGPPPAERIGMGSQPSSAPVDPRAQPCHAPAA